MDGRDIGTAVLPNATLKVYLTASAEERARRRLEQNANETLTFEEIKKLISERDYQDSHRAEAPLCQAEDAVLVDTSKMSIEEVVAHLCDYISQNPREC